MPAEISEFAAHLQSADHVWLEGMFTHFTASEIIDSPMTESQISRFDEAVDVVSQSGLCPTYFHLCNSAGIAIHQSAWRNMVRPGISLYGYYLPFTSALNGMPDPSLELPVKPALTWKTRIMAIREVAANQPIGYEGAYMTDTPSRIAVLPVGYADGLRRELSSTGRVIVRGDYASIVGTIAMEMTTIDVTGIPGVAVNDEVILIGGDEKRRVTAWDHASAAATIPHDILCTISQRIPRKYYD